MVLGGSVAFYLRLPGFTSFSLPDTEVDVAGVVSSFARLGHPFIGLSNDFAPILAFMFFMMSGIRMMRRRLLYTTLATLCAVGVVLTFSRGVLLAFVLGGLACAA